MSVCHLHVLITNRTEEMPRSVSGMGTEHTTHQHLHQLAREQRGHTVTQPSLAASSCVCLTGAAPVGHASAGDRHWKEDTGGKQGEIRWDNQLQYLKACD